MHVFYGICVVLFVLDFVIHRHVMHSWENLWGFYPLYGFVGCVVLVLVATWMRTFLMRSEDYYDNEGQADIDKKPVPATARTKSMQNSFYIIGVIKKNTFSHCP